MNEPQLMSAHVVDDLGIHPDVVAAALGSGIDVPTLLRYLVAYGPVILQVLSQTFHWNLPLNPLPPPPPLPVSNL